MIAAAFGRRLEAKSTQAKLVMFTCMAIVALTVAYAVYATATAPRWIVDDSFILFRYADNLANHGQLNWNLGENPVEGYTGATLVFLLSIAIKLGISPILASHVIGIACFFLGGLFILLILRGFNVGSAVALALYFAAPFMYTHEWSGLETTLFAAAMLFSVYAFTSRHRALFLFSIILLSLTRPEGALLAAILFLIFRPFSYKSLFIFVTPLLVYFLWRWAYYGRIFPNTYYAKKVATDIFSMKFLVFCLKTWIRNPAAVPYAGSQSSALTENVLNVLSFFKEYLLRPALVVFVLIVWTDVRRCKYLVFSIGAFCAIALFVYLPFKLEMNFSYRFLAPFYPLVILGLAGILKKSDTPLKLILALALLVVPQIRMNIGGMPAERQYTSTYKELMDEAHIAIGEYLRKTFSPNDWLVVHADAGAIPYYSRLKTVDFGRLNDEYLTRKRRSESEIVDYFFSRNATAMVLTMEARPSQNRARELEAILADPRLGNYTIVKVYGADSRPGYSEVLYVRNDLLRH
ncbi:MAG: hypothetical protein NTW97_00385 [Candidatus Krumholzibacteria bacterium]|nr:hypothetical protein [Candidatus Krumholzibacteria bacterium]